MSGFDADDIETLDFNLTKYGGPRGTIPEPSTDQIAEWAGELAAISFEAEPETRGLTREQMAELIAEVSKKRPELNRRALAAYARLCGGREVTNKSKARGAPKTVWEGGSPTYDELAALPHRIRAMFCGWLTGKLQDPEPEPGATSS